MAKKYKVEIDVDVKGEEKVDELNKDLEQTQQEQDGVNEGFADMGGAADAALGGMVGKFAKFKTSIMSSVKSLGVLKVAVAATGLGLLLLVIASIRAAFTSTEEGQNKFAKLMNAIGVVTGNLIDLLASLGEKIIWAFEHPREALDEFVEAFKKNIEVRIQSTIKMFGFLGSAIKKLFSGDFSGAMDDATKAGESYIDMLTGVEDTLGKATEVLGDFIDEQKKEIAIMNELSDLQASIDRRERGNLIERAKLEVQISELREKAIDRERYSALQRIGFLEEALIVQNAIYDAEIKLSKDRLEIQRERNKLAGSTKDDLLAEAQLQADLIRLEKQRLDGQKFIFQQIQSYTREMEALRKKVRDGEVKDTEEQMAFRVKATAEFYEELSKEQQQYMEQQAQAWGEYFNTIAGIAGGEMAVLAATIKQLVDEVKVSGEQTGKAILAVTGAAMQAGAALINSIADEVDASSREGFEKQKKLRLTGIVMDTFAAMIAGMLAGLSIGGPWGIALGVATAAMAGAFGGAQYNKASQVEYGSTGAPNTGSAPRVNAPGGGGGGGGAPAFGLINPLSAGDSALQGLLGERDPSRSYVVSDDVTSEQSLDRQIQTQASY